MAPALPPVATTRIPGDRRRPDRLIAAAVVLVVVAIVKPWGWLPALPDRPAPVVAAEDPAAPMSPAPVPDPSAGPGEMLCPPAGWELMTLDRLADWSVRTWEPIAPVVASGPLDAAIPTVRLEADGVVGLGVCAPPTPTGATAGGPTGLVAGIAAVWRLDAPGRSAVPVAVGPIDSDRGDGAGHPAIARLVRPLVRSASTWPEGRYVVELTAPAVTADVMGTDRSTGPEAGGQPRWLGLVVGGS